jgi:hypothetical protein
MESAMTATRTISLPTHGALELLTGLAAMLLPLALGLTPAGTIISGLIGALAVGLALDATAPARVSAHHAFDYGLAFGAVLAALLLALSGDGAAALLLGALGLAQLGLNGATRYSAA